MHLEREREVGNMTLIVIAYVIAAAALFWVGMVTFFLGGSVITDLR
jgi:hypothetical protein